MSWSTLYSHLPASAFLQLSCILLAHRCLLPDFSPPQRTKQNLSLVSFLYPLNLLLFSVAAAKHFMSPGVNALEPGLFCTLKECVK